MPSSSDVNPPAATDWHALSAKLQAIGKGTDLIHEWPATESVEVPLAIIATPPDPETVSEIVREASRRAAPVYPLGGCTSLDYGLPAPRAGLGLDLSGLRRVIDYPARDMTMTVGAGISIARLSEIMSGENQRLPVDIAERDRATLGGAIATNASGPRRFGFGTLRDYVIGIQAVDGLGTVYKAGGRVVKNVAGYDLCKLLVGSVGTLGVITEITLKLRPQAEASALVGAVVADGRTDQLDRLLAGLLTSRTRPVAIEVLNAPAACELAAALENPAWFAEVPRSGRLLLVGFEGTAAEVQWQRQRLREEWLGDDLPLWERAGQEAAPLWQLLTEFPTQPAALTFKANLLSSRVPMFFRLCDGLPVRLASHAGNGIVTGHVHDVSDVQEAGRILELIRQCAVLDKGNAIVLRCPADWKSELGVWGRPRGDWALMEKVRRKLDPHGILNPGRFVNGK